MLTLSLIFDHGNDLLQIFKYLISFFFFFFFNITFVNKSCLILLLAAFVVLNVCTVNTVNDGTRLNHESRKSLTGSEPDDEFYLIRYNNINFRLA